ncbi:type VII toxin-antitoxin system HepT family RNase toxin [Halalkalibacter urbisdiaboli]|uniref:type VII toxin-antitoxin system HepT family RNase toxin n=1 Tax=Halalkalibacter urbisdiaboli TaxID=1960589 RepID=UPI000B43363E|nr:DUF86 domain-containing protein [Halalkalibacter urbisdiaboli]
MYFVDREKIEQTLRYYEDLVQLLNEDKQFTTRLDRLALERVSYVIIESIIDVGNSMIDGFIMRDPGSYEDIIDILEDESVIPAEDAKALKEVVRCRKSLVQDYANIDHSLLESTIRQHIFALIQFPKAVRRYLVEELGPVSAFLPEDGKKG